MKSTAFSLITGHPCTRKWARLWVTGSEESEEQRDDMLLSPVCVPSVCKLHQQHKLDQQENEPANSSYIAPHCAMNRGRDRKIVFWIRKTYDRYLWLNARCCTSLLQLITSCLQPFCNHRDILTIFDLAKYIMSVLSLPSRKVSSSGRKKPPAQHPTSAINFRNQNLTFNVYITF